jgi:phage shock protein C
MICHELLSNSKITCGASVHPEKNTQGYSTSSIGLQLLSNPCVCPFRNHRKECNIMNTNYKQLTRSTSNRMIAGVCAGLGEYLGIDPTIVRLLAVLAFFTGFGGIAIVYLVMALVVPEQPASQSTQIEQ